MVSNTPLFEGKYTSYFRVCRRALLSGSALGSAFLLATAAAAQQENAPISLPTLSVEGSGTGDYKVDEPNLQKLTEPVLDTPTSMVTVSKQVMDDRGQTTLNDALRNVPGITLGAGEFLWQGNNPYIRGFSARTDMFLDGMRDFGDYYRDPFNLEEVEVLEGPDSILFGRGSTGGVINQVSKTPQLRSFETASVAGGTNDAIRATADLNLALPQLGEGTAVRLNLMANDNGVAGRDVVDYQRWGIAPSLALGIGTPTRLLFSYVHQSERDLPDYGIPWYFGRPADVDRSNFYGYRQDFLNNDDDIVTGKVEHDLTEQVMLRAQLRYANYDRSERIDQPVLPSTATLTTPLNTIDVTLKNYQGHSVETQFESQFDAVAKFETGSVKHDVVAGVEYDHETSNPYFFNSIGQSPTSLLFPDNDRPYTPSLVYPRVVADTTTDTVGVYALDTIKFTDQLQLLAGVRFDSFAAKFDETTYSVPPAPTGFVVSTNPQDHTNSMTSYRAALVYKPVPNGTVYFSFGTSFNPSAEGLSFLNSGENFNVANQNLSPEKNRNFELGTKWSVLDNRLFLSAAVFRSEKTNARIPNPELTGFNQLAGNQRVDGFELQMQGQITPEWNITAGYDYLNSTTTQTVPGGPPLGFQLPFTPHNNLTLWTTYLVLPKLQLGAGGQWVDKRFAQTTQPIESVPGYVTFDASIKYWITPNYSAQVNIYNITDRYYYDTPHPHFIIPGAARSAMFTLTAKY